MTNSDTKLTSRPYQNDDDFWKVRALLDETYRLTPPGFNWEVRRWDGWRYYRSDLTLTPEITRKVRLWETKNGRLIGVVHPEGSGDAQLQLHPKFRHIMSEMITWAEENLGKETKEGRRELSIWSFEYDTPRRLMLEKHGFEKQETGAMMRRLRLGQTSHPEPSLADGYTLRTTNPTDLADCEQIAALLNVAFSRNFHTAVEYQNFTQNAPCFRADLDFVAVAPDDSFAAYAGLPYHGPLKYGIFEPICTHPDHLRKGLARALMLEGLRRLEELGAADCYVATGGAIAANSLYDAVGFTEAYRERRWTKTL